MQREPVIFSSVSIEPGALTQAGREYLAVRYATSRNYIARAADGALDFEKSSLNCYGFLLCVARDVGWLPADFDLARARWRAGQTFDEALWELLETNFVRVDKGESRTDDVLLMWFRDLPQADSAPHHVAIQSADGAENGRRGAMIHAIENGPNMQGAVIEQEIDALEWTRIHSVWRAKSIV